MKNRIIDENMIIQYRRHIIEEEKSTATIQKYIHDLRHFVVFAAGRPADKELMLQYKAHLQQEYALTSANSMIAAINAFMKFIGWHDCSIRQFRVQKKIYCSEESFLTRAEYTRMIRAAVRLRNRQLELIIQTLGSTGMRVSELRFITVESVHRGEAQVQCKGKNRIVFILPELRKKLLKYIVEKNLSTGSVFLGKHGRPLNRSLIWKKMKELCSVADVDPGKVFPHNLRHLFARLFYEVEKDIAKLADILGHTSINTTRVYIITTGSEHREKMRRLKLII